MLVYRLAVTIYDLTVIFCNQWVEKKSRTFDQMIQAARSGKQNIAEASKELSISSELVLNSVSRSSYTELLEDYEDFLRQRNLSIWKKDDSRVLRIRSFKESVESYTNLTDLSDWTSLDFGNPENFANLMICLCFKQGYLMDQLIRSKQEKFIQKGGFRENLFRKRQEYRNSLSSS